ncbi:MAG: 16S rRNA (cytosine(1402)-N(4))-methyltransferase RsmH [Muribaculaceae bacterium]|nr:16S rRNA (cytosine(1402)-N(4))-methyltransferase RsmH [Muribaculaceae bacterium]
MDNNNTLNISLPYHTPALLNEAIEALDIKPGGIYADATFGGGGHSRAIVEKLGAGGHLFGFDQDADAINNAIDDERFTFVRSNFRYMPNFIKYHGHDRLDGILADLGVSFHHFDTPDRGFTFRDPDAPLDMRMNQAAGSTAADILNNASEKEIIDILRLGSDLKNPARLAKAIRNAADKSPIETSGQLMAALDGILNPKNEKKDLAQIYQALRIAVNHEIDVLREFLNNCQRLLKPGGRLAVITYHSLEDRLVKNLMKTGNPEGNLHQDFFGNIASPWKVITRQPITPSDEEIETNPRSRSAKLRVAEKIASH